MRRSDYSMDERVKQTDFPIRALRYWWIFHMIREFSRDRRMTVVDLGAQHGQMRRYWTGAADIYSSQPELHWIGMDWEIAPQLVGAGYDRVIQCDFDQKLPLPDKSADIVIFLHVVEHLPRPEFTIGEIARILSDDGTLLAGSPTAPHLVSLFIDRQLKRRIKHGTKARGAHIHSFSPARWKELVKNAGLTLEFLSGTHFARLSGRFIENYSWWARLNLFWGARFPSLGSDVCVCASKTPNPLASSRTVQRENNDLE